jgi:Zn-dependent protease with chaperone function
MAGSASRPASCRGFNLRNRNNRGSWGILTKPYQRFEARAFHPDLNKEVVEGTIFFTNLALRFESNEAVLEIPLHRLAAEIEQGDPGRIFFSDPQQPGLQISTSDASVLEFRSVPQLARLGDQLSAHLTRRELSRRLKLVLSFFAVCGLILWLGMLATGAMVRSIVGRVPPEFEKQYGDGMLEELRLQMNFVDESKQVAQLTAMAAPLLRALPGRQPQWRFHLVENEAPNAFALPGGHIIICTGLLQLADRPEEVLGTVAHEVAHVTQKHGFRRQISSAGPFLVFQIFLRGRGGAVSTLAGGSALLVSQSFSQEYEEEADDAGWQYLIAANIDPRSMIDMFRKLKAYDAKQKNVEWLPQAFRSHPALEKRIARLEAKWKRLPRKSGFVQFKPEKASEHY